MRFFNVDTKNEKEFIYDLVFGFMPRKFDASDEQDRIIYDEEEEVSEMFFIQEGTIEIAFSLIYIQRTDKSEKFNFGCKYKSKILICDHYVVNKQKTQFIYIA